MKVSPNILGGGYAALVLFLWTSVAMDYQNGIYRTIVYIGNRKLELNRIESYCA